MVLLLFLECKESMKFEGKKEKYRIHFNKEEVKKMFP